MAERRERSPTDVLFPSPRILKEGGEEKIRPTTKPQCLDGPCFLVSPDQHRKCLHILGECAHLYVRGKEAFKVQLGVELWDTSN